LGVCSGVPATLPKLEIGRIGRSLASLEIETPHLNRQMRRLVLLFTAGLLNARGLEQRWSGIGPDAETGAEPIRSSPDSGAARRLLPRSHADRAANLRDFDHIGSPTRRWPVEVSAR